MIGLKFKNLERSGFQNDLLIATISMPKTKEQEKRMKKKKIIQFLLNKNKNI